MPQRKSWALGKKGDSLVVVLSANVSFVPVQVSVIINIERKENVLLRYNSGGEAVRVTLVLCLQPPEVA